MSIFSRERAYLMWKETDVVWTKNDTHFVVLWAYLLLGFPRVIGGMIASCRHALMSKK